VAKRIADEITARGTIDVLRKGVKEMGQTLKLAYFVPAHELTPELRAQYEANILTVTRQAHVSESNASDSVDLLLLLNGLPVATAELKTQFTGQNIENAINQYRHDRKPSDLIFRARSVVNFALDQDAVAMATKLTGASTIFLPFNLGSNGPGRDGGAGNPAIPGKHRTAYLWEHVWQRDTWLKILGSYVHVADVRDKAGKKTGSKFTIFPRYHQFDAVSKLLTATVDEGPGHNKLIQHSAGSGKSNTIAWLAHQLSSLHTAGTAESLGAGAKEAGLGANEPIFDKIIIVTDRKVLDRQLQDTVESFDHQPGVIRKIDENSSQLREALEGKTARVIITTLQKFPVVAQNATELSGSRFAVIVDEAHSSQSGEAVKDLKAVLTGKTGAAALEAAEAADSADESTNPDVTDLLERNVQARGKQTNLTFYAFTATPKYKTLALFGERVPDPKDPREEIYVPFHLYSMRQAIEEKYILDVLADYTTYKTYYRLANNLGTEDVEVPKGKAASLLARYVSLHPTNLSQKAEIIVEHFRAHTAKKIDGRAKAMVVTASRLHAVRYYEAISKYIAARGYDKGDSPVKALVAFSGTVVDPDVPTMEYTESKMNQFPERELPERFEDEYQVLVVAEKYQTGFDQPLLHTMYVDKKLDGVKAVQTLSRLNRSAQGKEDTFVLDFVNDAADIQKAFAPFYNETVASPTDANILYTLQRRIMDAHLVDPADIDRAVEAILIAGEKGNAQLSAATDPAYDLWTALEDEDEKEQFRTAVRDFVRSYSFLAQIVPFHDTDLEKLYYYCKFLATRLTKPVGTVDIDGAVVLTHLRTELIAEGEDVSLGKGDGATAITGPGTGAGKQTKPPEDQLSAIIEQLNEKFGASLTDVDKIFITQIAARLAAEPDAKTVANGNDLQQFGVYMRPRIDDGVIDSHESNGALLNMYFGNDGAQEIFRNYIIETLYNALRAS
jgi:type I restriction enzyme R subunit